MNIKLFTYMDMCPNCWTVWYRCFNDLQEQYNHKIKQYNSKIKRKKQLNLDVNVYSIKPYSFTNHKYISVLNSDNYDIKQYSNDFLKNLSNINEWKSRDFYKRRNSKKIDCNYNFSQRVDISNFNIIKKYHDLIDNVKNNNNKIYNYDNNTIVYYYNSIRSILLDNTKQKKNNTANKKQKEKEQQIVQPHKYSFLYKHLKSLCEFIIENKCDNNVFYIIQDCFKQVVIELFNLYIRNYDKESVKIQYNTL